MTLFRNAKPFCEMPPTPASSESARLVLTVTLRSRISPSLRMPPARLASLSATTLSTRSSSPWFQMPPPNAPVAWLPLIDVRRIVAAPPAWT